MHKQQKKFWKERDEKMENKMHLEFTSKSCNERFARMTATAFAALLDPTVEELAEIKTAISEAVTNAMIHGYAQKTGPVVLEGEIHENTIIFSVRDYGCGIENIEKAKEPLSGLPACGAMLPALSAPLEKSYQIKPSSST